MKRFEWPAEERIRVLEEVLTAVCDTYLTNADKNVVGMCWCSPSLSYDGHAHKPRCRDAQAALPMPRLRVTEEQTA